MSPRTRDLILAKLQILDEYAAIAAEIGRRPKSVFLEDKIVSGAAERYLQLAIEALLDIGKLLIIERGLRRPENSHEILEILHAAGILSDELYQALQGTPGFRNVLVHDYAKVDKEIVYRYLTQRLDDFAAYRKAIVRAIT